MKTQHSPSLRLLGGFSLSDVSGTPILLTLRKTEALIAYLAASTSKRQQRNHVAGLLWSESTQASALQNLRQARLTLLRDLAAHNLPFIKFTRSEITLDDSGLQIDIVEFLRLQSAGDLESLTRAANLYQGDFLTGFEVDSAPFEEWLRQTRAWYREQIESVLRGLLTLQEQAGDNESAIHTAKRLLALDPLREDIRRWLMRAFAAAGYRTSALAIYDACRTLLSEELGVVPAPETDALYHTILQRSGEPQAVAEGSSSERRSHAPQPMPVQTGTLSGATLAVLQLAAICANHFTRELLDAVSEQPASEIERALSELQTQSLLHWDAKAGRGTIHESIRRKILDNLLPAHRRHLHCAVAEALQHIAGPESGDFGCEIVEHYRQAGRWEPAVSQQLRLIQREINLGRLDGADLLLNHVLSDITRLPDSAMCAGLELNALLLASRVAELRGDLESAEARLANLKPALKRNGQDPHLISALLTRARLSARKGQQKSAYSALRQIPQSAKTGATENLWLLPERFATSPDILIEEGRSPAEALLRRRAAGLRTGEAEYAALQALRLARQEKFAAAYSACTQAVQYAKDLPDPTCLIVSLQTLAIIQIWDGDPAAALPTLERSDDLASGHGDLLRLYTTQGYLGFALMNVGRAAEAGEKLRQALAMAERMRLPFMAAMFTAWFAGTLFEAGAAEEAAEVARRAVHLANERNEPWARSVALRFLGQALATGAGEGTRLVDRILRSAQEIQSGLGLTFETNRTIRARREIARTPYYHGAFGPGELTGHRGVSGEQA